MSFLLGIIYLSFISLGLPDALLGSAWPNMYPEFQVPVSYAGMISMIIAFGTILSSLQSDRLTRRFGTGKVTAASVGITALALWGFSVSHSFLQLCLWAIPYGLGAVLTGGAAWNKGYRVISLLQIVLTAVLIISLPKWKEENPAGEETKGGETAYLQGNYFHSGGKGNHALFLLLLRCRTDNDALGKQLLESCKRN